MACKWCCNPDSWTPYPEIMIFEARCICCGRCVEACPRGAIAIVDELRVVDWNKCNQCLECVRVCPSEAIEQVGTYMSVEMIMREISKDALFYIKSGGGVTFSGGEPLSQWQLVEEACRLCKQKGLHTALETSGYGRWDIMEQVLQYVDLVLYDLKHLDAMKHIEGTGVSNQVILANLERTAARKRTWLRVPLIPSFNDSESLMDDIAELAKQLKVEKVSLLPYHEWGKGKYAGLGRTYPFEGADTLSNERIGKCEQRFKSAGERVDIGS